MVQHKVRKKGKGLLDPCVICGEARFRDKAHFPKRKRIGEEGTDIIPLCPTHHRLLDNGRLSRKEFERIMLTCYKDRFNSVEDFICWANDNFYPYTVEDLKRKFWDYEPK